MSAIETGYSPSPKGQNCERRLPPCERTDSRPLLFLPQRLPLGERGSLPLHSPQSHAPRSTCDIPPRCRVCSPPKPTDARRRNKIDSFMYGLDSHSASTALIAPRLGPRLPLTTVVPETSSRPPPLHALALFTFERKLFPSSVLSNHLESSRVRWQRSPLTPLPCPFGSLARYHRQPCGHFSRRRRIYVGPIHSFRFVASPQSSLPFPGDAPGGAGLAPTILASHGSGGVLAE